MNPSRSRWQLYPSVLKCCPVYRLRPGVSAKRWPSLDRSQTMKTKKTGFNSTGEVTGLTQDEKVTSLFQPDTLLSDQYFENFRRKTVWQPEKRLMLAILRDAIACYQDNLY